MSWALNKVMRGASRWLAASALVLKQRTSASPKEANQLRCRFMRCDCREVLVVVSGREAALHMARVLSRSKSFRWRGCDALRKAASEPSGMRVVAVPIGDLFDTTT